MLSIIMILRKVQYNHYHVLGIIQYRHRHISQQKFVNTDHELGSTLLWKYLDDVSPKFPK